jgi:hypothetical protein
MALQPGIGNMIAFIDLNDEAFIYSPVEEMAHKINDWVNDCVGILWESNQNQGGKTLIAWTNTKIYVYSYTARTWKGPQSVLIKFAPTSVPAGCLPLFFKGGRLSIQLGNGTIKHVDLKSHQTLSVDEFLQTYPTETDQGRALRAMLALGKLDGKHNLL